MLEEEYMLIAKSLTGDVQSYYLSIKDEAEDLFEKIKREPETAYVEICAGIPGHWRSVKLFERTTRLTRWNGHKWVLPQGAWREIAERLAEYEDMGSPEEIHAKLTSRGWSIPEEILHETV